MRSWPELSIPELSSGFALPALSLYNTASAQVEELAKKKIYRMYVCGITPYDATHLGHAATYLTFDLINRYLRATGSEVLFVQNITDIDDPLLERAQRDGISWSELAESQINLFRGDMADLHVLPPSDYVGVVEAIPLVITAIEKLQIAQTTYQVEEDLYFRIHSDPEFGTRSHYTNSQMLEIFAQRGGDPQRAGKENPFDALLWLAQREGEPGWPSPFGIGRPGWHIECCAIALNYLKPDPRDDFAIDIQGGGSDLIFPHHEMSAAQSRIIGDQRFARMYVHGGMIGLDGEKMSKSLGNLVFVSALIQQGVEPTAIRWALMGHRYSEDLMWSDSLMSTASEEVERLRLNLARMEVAPTTPVIENLIAALSKNLDTPEVLDVLRRWMLDTESGVVGGEAGELGRALDSLLGFSL
ncbi:MAG: cysteine--1-D-myo-inosityl 2-amino-2-deoxy-alpha-D-glucopyranoside ligase [Actinobacteria bacterium]|nr:cysteine--1-D-myo-inosityl 2-amino-2-deoxy-alpha-D-glucopyranoside ligase [Actinomycetota bacterium]